MAAKSYSRAHRFAAVALARMAGVDTASSLLVIDKRTLRDWVAKAPPEDEVDGYRAVDQMVQQQLLTAVATGQVRNAVTLATAGGISRRQVNYRKGELAVEQRREDEQATEQADPEEQAIAAVVDAMPQERTRYVADAIRYELERRGIEGDAPAEVRDGLPDVAGTGPLIGEGATMVAWLEGVRDFTEERFATERAALDAAFEALKVLEVEKREERAAATERERVAAAALRAAEPPPEPPQPAEQPILLDEHRGQREAWTSSDGDRLIEVVDGAGRHRHVDPWSPY